MRRRTGVAIVLVFGLVAAVVAAGLLVQHQSPPGFTERWVSTTGTTVGGNHHAPAVGRVRGTGFVFAPVSAPASSAPCALYALHERNGTVAWRHPIPAANCTIHAVADPALADYDRDGLREVLVATTERTVTARQPFTGQVELQHDLSSYGYSRPVVANLTGDGRPEVVVVDVRGTVVVLAADGRLHWSRSLAGHAWGQPAVTDLDGDGGPELVVGLGGRGGLHSLEPDGSSTWDDPPSFTGSITWLTTGNVDEDPGREVVVGTAGGTVAVVDGTAGRVQWQRDLGRLAAVHPVADGDGDGQAEVYAVAADGVIRSLDGRDGRTEWRTRLAQESAVQMMPPPVLGDVTGDGRVDLVAPANNGVLSLLDPATGTIEATYRRDDRLYAPPVLGDVDGDGVATVYVVYGDGSVVALEGPRSG